MNVNGNDIIRSCYEWWMGGGNCKSYFELSKSEIDELHDKMKNDIIRKLNTHNYHSTKERHNSIVDIIRIANAMAYVNGVNINRYIKIKEKQI